MIQEEMSSAFRKLCRTVDMDEFLYNDIEDNGKDSGVEYIQQSLFPGSIFFLRVVEPETHEKKRNDEYRCIGEYRNDTSDDPYISQLIQSQEELFIEFKELCEHIAAHRLLRYMESILNDCKWNVSEGQYLLFLSLRLFILSTVGLY